MEKFIKPQDVAAILGCSISHIYSLLEAGLIRAIDIGAGKRRRCYRIPEPEIERLIQNHIVDMDI